MRLSLGTFCTNIDLFGKRPQLYISGNTKYSTRAGIVLTVLLFLLCIICLGYFGKDVYTKKNPEVIYGETYNFDPEAFTFDRQKLPFIVGLNSKNGTNYFTEKRLLNVTISEFVLKNGRPEPNLRMFLMDVCTPDHFKDLDAQAKEYFLKFNLKNYFCVGRNVSDMKLQGAFDQEFFSSISITVNRCENYTGSKIICASQEEIQKEISYGYIGIYLLDYNIDNSEIRDYKSFSPKEVFTNFVLKSSKVIDLLFRNNHVITEDGLIFENLSEDKVTNLDNFREFNFITEKVNFFEFNLKLSQKTAYHKRKFKKIQDVLAKVGGMFNIFYLIALIVQTFYVNLLYVIEILNDIFILAIRRKSILQRNSEEKRSQTREGISISIPEMRGKGSSSPSNDFSQRLSRFLARKSSIHREGLFLKDLGAKEIQLESQKAQSNEGARTPLDCISSSQADIMRNPNASGLNNEIKHEKPCEGLAKPPQFFFSQGDFASYSAYNRKSVSEQYYPLGVIKEEGIIHKCSEENISNLKNLSSMRQGLVTNKILRNQGDADAEVQEIDEDLAQMQAKTPQQSVDLNKESLPKMSPFSVDQELESQSDQSAKRHRSKERLSISRNQMQNEEEPSEKEPREEDKIEHFKIEFGLLDFVNYYTGFFNTPERHQKNLLIKKGVSLLKEKLGIHQIIEKLYEIDKLKFILLDEHQSEVFSLLPKPQLEIIEEEELEHNHKYNTLKNKLIKKITRFEFSFPTFKGKSKAKPKVSATLFNRHFSHFERIKKDSQSIQEEVLDKFTRREDKMLTYLDRKLLSMVNSRTSLRKNRTETKEDGDL